MELTKENYYEHAEYMSASQFKDFLKCPACAMAKIKGEWQPKKSKRLLLGSYVDETLTGDAESRTKFWDENREDIIQKNGKLYAEFEYANQVIERISKQPLMMKYLNGENQVIMTGKIEGVPVKIKMDSYKPHKFIADLKYMRSLRSPNLFTPMIKYWGYDLQAAIYQEIVYQNTGERLPFVFVIATKEKPAHLAVAEISQFDMDAALDIVKARIKEFDDVKNGRIPAERCEKYDCDYCAETKILTELIDCDALGLDIKEDK